MITRVLMNHEVKNYFDDNYDLVTSEMGFISKKAVSKAIDKMVRRHKADDTGYFSDVLFVYNDDGTGWRLMYDYAANFEEKSLVLTHYLNISLDSWDTAESVTTRQAKERILEELC